MSSRVISIPVQFVAALEGTEGASDAQKRIETRIRSAISVTELSLQIGTIESENCSQQEYEHSRVVRLNGKVVLRASDRGHEDVALSFVRRFVAIGLKSVYMSVDPSCREQDVVFFPMKLPDTVQTTSINDFRLGSRVGYTDFVSHFGARRAGLKSFRMTVSFEHDLSKFQINLFDHDGRSSMLNVGMNYEVRVNYDAVSAVIIMPVYGEGDGLMRVYFILKSPPLLYEMMYTDADSKSAAAKSFCRTTRVPVRGRGRGIPKLDWGRSNVLTIDLLMPGPTVGKPASQKPLIDPWRLMSNFKRFTDFVDPIPFYFAHMDEHNWKRFMALRGLSNEKWFPVFYSVRCCMSISHQFSDDLCLAQNWDKFFRFVKQQGKERIPVVELAFADLFTLLERNTAMSVMPMFEDILARYVASKYTDCTSVTGVQKIRRAVVTPTRVILLPLHPFVDSRLMRVCEPDFVLRCQVREDDDSMLTFSTGGGPSAQQKWFLKTHLRDPVQRGIRVGHRSYHLMGSSCSQMREHGFVMYAEDDRGYDANYYRHTMGDFSGIRCVGKYIARFGQAFSQMLESVVIDPQVLDAELADVKHGRHPKSGKTYCYTDGVGIASYPLAVKRFVAKLGLDFVPSAFQIRYKGCKGMVVVHHLFNAEVEFLGYRESMNKFPCDLDTLEILKYSCPRHVYLNRPLINLLDQLGTPFKAFDRLLVDGLTYLTQAFFNEDAAMECISSYCPQISQLMKLNLIGKSGLSILSEPFFRKVLDIVVRKKFRELRENMRLEIPFNKGRSMFGVADEQRCLEYGEVFVQYTAKNGEKQILTGEVMVTRNPCMHPGDVRKLKAVDKLQLHHIVDCIVFPTKGPRPHPNEMGGGDLDGDEYCVIWMKDLFFTKPNQPAMIYSDEPAVELDHPVEVKDIMDFICDFIRTNKVGLIGNAHLAISDKKGITDPQSLRLCEMYSEELDFAKTGRKMEMQHADRAKHYPEFMEKGDRHSTYKSDRALGVLFAQVSFFEGAICKWDNETNVSYPPNPHINCSGWQEYEEIALTDFAEYKMTCESLLKDLGIESEEYLLSCICQRNGKFAIGKKEDMQDLMERIVREKFSGFRSRFVENTASESDREKKAVAYYMVARVNQNSAPGKKWYGFPWIAGPELAALGRKKGMEKDPQESAIAALIDSVITSQHASISDPKRKAALFLGGWIDRELDKSEDDPRLDFTARLAYVWDTLDKISSQEPALGGDSSPHDLTAGELVIRVLKKLMADMMAAWKDNDGDEDRTFKVYTLGVHSMISLNKCFRSGKIDCLKSSGSASAKQLQLKLRKFHVPLATSFPAAREFAELLVHHENQMLEYLVGQSRVENMTARIVSQHNFRFWLVTALGSEFSLARLADMLIQRGFHAKTAREVNQLIEQQA